MLSVVLASFLVLLDNSIVSTAIPSITDEFHSLSDVGWYGSAYTLGNASLQLLTGKTFQFFNLKWSWLMYFGLFELGSAVCGAAQSSNMLIIGRVIAGAGAAGVVSGAFTIISACVPLEKRPLIIGMMMSVTQLGNIAGPIVGGAFTTGYTWRWCFYINLPVGAVVAFPLMLLNIPEQVPKETFKKALPKVRYHLDLLGFVIFAPAITQLFLAL
ncbi:major facilitator superfamily domain-containing protein [Xylariaceae sp. FL0804]|nr:major facilitator superfamily domain-containing protein [Xylariaceae sp. FL0804]